VLDHQASEGCLGVVGVIVSTAGVIYLAFSNVSGGQGMKAFGWGEILTNTSALSWTFYCTLLRLKDKQVKNTSFVYLSSLIGNAILADTIFLIFSIIALVRLLEQRRFVD